MTKRILLVDDEARIRSIIRLSLEHLCGWEVIEAECGAIGLQAAHQVQPDAILLDMSMPDLDGMAFLERLQDDPQTAIIPTVFLTAKVPTADEITWAGRQRPANLRGTLTKPFDPLLLGQQVAALLGWAIAPTEPLG